MASVMLAGAASAQTLATLTDLGAGVTPVPGPDDIYQTNMYGTGYNPGGLNYYFNNTPPPGQTFTTSNNPNGYIVTSLSLQMAGNGGGLPAAGQPYVLRFYAINSPTNAALMASYVSTNVVLTASETDWLQWTNLGGLALPPNSQFAYSFAFISTGAGWLNQASMNNDPTVYGSPSSGDVALIPTGGGLMTLDTTSNNVATFDLGLQIASALVVEAPTISPSSSVTAGTAVTLSPNAAGAVPLSYQWQTDGGSGGALTNIPAATTPALSVNTANWNPGAYQYDVVVSNASGAITSSVAVLGISYATTAALLTDAGDNITSGPYDISQYVGGGSGNGLNYYDDNGASHGGNYIGQTFVTGTNSKGYYIDSVALLSGNGGSSGTTTAQAYHLFIYSMSGENATLLAHYTNASFSFTFGDWLVWSGFSIILKPNSTYAYAFGRDTSGTGWAALDYSPTNCPGPYADEEICIIPQGGGPITAGEGCSAAVFDIGLLAVGVGTSPVPFANPVAASPSRLVIAGTQVTLNENASGQAPLHFHWQTDGGTGTITNIPGNDSSNLVINTTGWTPGVYQYDVIASNAFGFSKSAVLDLTIIYANTTAVLSDMGTATPSVEANDVAQPVLGTSLLGGGSPDGLNYYFDNANPPGQVFTTSSNSAGYVLSSVAIPLAGGSGNLPAAGQQYLLRIYSVSGNTATLFAVYTSESNFIFTDLDWLRWSGFAVPLAPNSTYAYTFGRISSGVGWDDLSCVSNSPPVYNGRACVIPPNGGQITYSKSLDQDATFIVGLALAQDPVVAPPVASPANVIYAGTPVTLSDNGVSGPGPYTYQWLTDGGSGNAPTNIPGANGPTLSINTSALSGNVAYALEVINGVGDTISETMVLTVNGASAPNIISDIAPGSFTTFVGGSASFSVSMDGTLPITYQWKVAKGTGSATNIVGQTNNTLNLSNVGLSDSGTYSLAATNSQGNNSSSTATLTVVPVPASPFTVNFQWLSYENSDNVGDYAGPGIPGYGTGTYWNQVINPNTTFTAGTYSCFGAVADNGNTQTGISWTLTTAGSWDWTSTPTIALLDSGASAYYPVAQPFTFALPNGVYNVVLFTCDGTESTNRDSVPVITLGGIAQTAAPTNDNAFILGETYLTWNGIAVTNATLTGTWNGGNSKQTLATLNGAQLQYIGPVVTLTAQPAANGQVQLKWSSGTLLQAPTVLGPWTTNTASSPYMLTPTPTTPEMFFKVIAP